MKFKPHTRGWPALPFFLLCLFISDVSLAVSPKPFIKLDIFTYCEPVSVKDVLFDEGKGRYTTGKHAFAWGWAETGVKWRDIGFSYILRYDYNLIFSNDTAVLCGLTTNKDELPLDQEFGLKMKADAFHAKGLRVSYKKLFYDRLNIKTGLSYLETNYFIDGDINGIATILSEKDYDYEASVHQQYTEDIVFERNVKEPFGHGFSIDLNADLTITRAWSLQLELIDIFSQIYWKNLPYTDATASSDRKQYDEDGYIHIDPALKGMEGFYSRYTQRISPRGVLDIRYSHGSNTTFFEGHFKYGLLLWNIGNDFSSTNGKSSLKYWPENNAATIGHVYKDFTFEITADHYDIEKIKLFKFLIGYCF